MPNTGFGIPNGRNRLNRRIRNSEDDSENRKASPHRTGRLPRPRGRGQNPPDTPPCQAALTETRDEASSSVPRLGSGGLAGGGGRTGGTDMDGIQGRRCSTRRPLAEDRWNPHSAASGRTFPGGRRSRPVSARSSDVHVGSRPKARCVCPKTRVGLSSRHAHRGRGEDRGRAHAARLGARGAPSWPGSSRPCPDLQDEGRNDMAVREDGLCASRTACGRPAGLLHGRRIGRRWRCGRLFRPGNQRPQQDHGRGGMGCPERPWQRTVRRRCCGRQGLRSRPMVRDVRGSVDLPPEAVTAFRRSSRRVLPWEEKLVPFPYPFLSMIQANRGLAKFLNPQRDFEPFSAKFPKIRTDSPGSSKFRAPRQPCRTARILLNESCIIPLTKLACIRGIL